MFDVHLVTTGCTADMLLGFLAHHHPADTIYLVGGNLDAWRSRRGWLWPQNHYDVLQEPLARAHEFAFYLNTWVNRAKRLWGGQYWSLSNWAKQQVKRAVNFISDDERVLAVEARRRGLDGIVCGHIHSACIQSACIRSIDGLDYINTGDWVESCSAAIEDADGPLRLIDWAANVALYDRLLAQHADVGSPALWDGRVLSRRHISMLREGSAGLGCWGGSSAPFMWCLGWRGWIMRRCGRPRPSRTRNGSMTGSSHPCSTCAWSAGGRGGERPCSGWAFPRPKRQTNRRRARRHSAGVERADPQTDLRLSDRGQLFRVAGIITRCARPGARAIFRTGEAQYILPGRLSPVLLARCYMALRVDLPARMQALADERGMQVQIRSLCRDQARYGVLTRPQES